MNGLDPSHRQQRLVAEKMIQIKAPNGPFFHNGWMWNPIASAPSGRNLELAVIDDDGVHALVFPCEKASAGWKNAATGARVDIRPTHWRGWNPDEQHSFWNPN